MQVALYSVNQYSNQLTLGIIAFVCSLGILISLFV